MWITWERLPEPQKARDSCGGLGSSLLCEQCQFCEIPRFSSSVNERIVEVLSQSSPTGLFQVPLYSHSWLAKLGDFGA